MNTQHLIAIATIAFAGATVSAAHAAPSQEDRFGEEPVATRSTLTRAAVEADTRLWQRAGLGQANEGDRSEAVDEASPQRLAEYQRLRSGSAFQAELRRAQGAQPVAGAAASETSH
ncbi:DUF4148 domain-containing protein [Acidovorax sp. SUPP2539]|uniref:DUF4148 domain-containing protein n=1 Tax=Acidovorax sp. SUPP2539 TaxID=2920878 RepID=UPI0023DE5DFB|nr:DUF4148 domain-containing protein [Acidovorax sp. SUPP2539]GKS89320.1 DUF4148 domain-containing protein [Acidovorax sp. SUPP2539]